ncbi:hypothetical protein RAB80_003887 [Fusarium oxysporum f. sp. vasinfectum]|nr:hypothetical protein RAB80_003887 [Fusarium oxysporum f. sp. vasinfectum]
MAMQMFEKWRLPDMLSDVKLALATAMTSETPGPNHEAAIQILKESLRLDEKRNDVQRQLKKLETIVSLEGCLARADQGDRHKELQNYWMGESERIGERYHNDDSIRQAELFMARGKFKSAEKLLKQRLVKCMDEKGLKRILKCQHLIFSSLFLSFGSSLHPEDNHSQVRAVVDQAAAALAAYRELGPYSAPLEFILHVSQALKSLGQNQDGQESNMVYAEALRYLEIGESISERLRRDLCSSSGLESLRQKQLLVASSTHDDIFNHALALTFALGDAEKMWRWTQRAKARALSDLVGSQLDFYTRQRPPNFVVDDQIVKLLEDEARLVRKLESAVSIDKISTSMELERVRSMTEETSAPRPSTCLESGKLASDFGSEPRLGCNANKENLTTVVKDVDILHFHGHTATHPNIIYQSLVLSDGNTSETSSGVQEFHHTQSSTSPYRPTLGPHKDAFTVRDAFSVDLNLSLASIVACSSGVQNYGTGDEPQGLLSALQYAGCATAIGTLWPVRSEDGRAFTLYFFQAVRRQGDNIASPWNLALSFQKAVRRLQGRKKAGLRLDHPYYWAAFVIHGVWYL